MSDTRTQAAELAQLKRDVDAFKRLSVTGGMSLTRGANGQIIIGPGAVAGTIFLRIGERAGTRYAHRQVQYDDIAGAWSVTVDGSVGTVSPPPFVNPAVELNLSTTVPPDVIVEAWPDPAGTGYLFDYCCPSSTTTTSTTTQVNCGVCGKGIWSKVANTTDWIAVSNTCPAGCVPRRPVFCPGQAVPCSTTETACVPAGSAGPTLNCASSSTTSSTTQAYWWGSGGSSGGGTGGDGGGGGSGTSGGACKAECIENVGGMFCGLWDGVSANDGFVGVDGPYATIDACYGDNAPCGKCIWVSSPGLVWSIQSDRCCGCGRACAQPAFAPSSACQYTETDCSIYTSNTSTTTTTTTTSSTTSTTTTTRDLEIFCRQSGNGIQAPFVTFCENIHPGNAGTAVTLSGPYPTMAACLAVCSGTTTTTGTSTTTTSSTTGTTTTTSGTTTTTTSSTTGTTTTTSGTTTTSSTTSTTTTTQAWWCSAGICSNTELPGAGGPFATIDLCVAGCATTTTSGTTGTGTSTGSG